MDERQSRIQEDLRGLLDGEVRCDDLFLQLYASDASVYQIRPLGVVLPRTTADVAACAKYAHANQLPLHARGAGTGLAGGALGPGLVVDFSRHMRRVLSTESDRVCIQPGLALERLNTHLAMHGRQFGPDPAMSHVTTMGSVAAVDGSGSHWLKYGSMRDHLIEVEAVLSDGVVVRLGREAVRSPHFEPGGERKRDLVEGVGQLLAQNADLIADKQSTKTPNCSGYFLAGAWQDEQVDMPRLLCGSEGTLALITELTVKTVPLPKHRGVALLLFDTLDAAARAVQVIVPHRPAACDLMDRRHLSLACDREPRYDLLIPPETEALLLVEFEGEELAEVHRDVQKVVDHVQRQMRMAFDARQAFEPDEIDLFWQLARRVVPTLLRVKGATRPLPFVEDMAVPPEKLPEFLVELQNVLKRRQMVASLFGHAGHGQLHVRPFLDLGIEGDVRKMAAVAAELYDAVIAVGGTISGEHGDGLSRTPFVRRQYGELYPVFQEVKRLFDPRNLLNPGKIVGDDPTLVTRNLRSDLAPRGEANLPTEDETVFATPPAVVELQLQWTADAFAETARNCNGCGGCRSLAQDVRMCPVFRFAPAEEASPRAKANLMRGLLSGELAQDAVTQDEFKRLADLCVNCQMCRLECPAGVDIPRLMVEAKAAYVSGAGLPMREWALAHLDLLSSLGSRASWLANWLVANRRARWLLERTLGIAQGRKLPRFASNTFLRRARRRRLTRLSRDAGPKVLYFVDTYANFHDPQLAEALVAVYEHNGVSVMVHPGQWSSGMALVTAGAVHAARRVARHNVTLLVEAVRQGYQIVCSEPSATLCLTREYPALLGDEESQLVADNTLDACDYLWWLHRGGKLKTDIKPVHATVGCHTPCHIKALQIGTPGENLLRLIPSLQVSKIDKGCSGMAGTFGLKQENYRPSLRAGWGLISSLRHTRLQIGAAECSACKMQMEQGTNKPTVHPLKLLALAYGLMPEVAGLLTLRPEELTVT